MNLITEKTTKEEVLEEYKTYPAVGGTLEEKPFYEARYAPIFYEIPMGSKVLDIGCNDGIFMEMLRDKRKCDIVGVDLSETALEEAKKKGLNVMLADAEKLPFEDESFDVVLCMELLSHLFDPSKALKEARRVLKKRGMLLGSCPHANLEKYAWDDKRMHRRYYEVAQLNELLGVDFERRYIKVLTAAQFSMSMAGSFLANEPAEMLFKIGGGSTQGWDEALNDRSILRCWFGFTQAPGTVYYRMSGYADKMQEMGAQVHYDPYVETEFNAPSEWCRKIMYVPSENRFTNRHIVDQLEQLLKAADMSVFQIAPNRDILLLLTTAKKGVIKKPMWIESDDWLFDIPSYNLASHPYSPNSEMERVAYDHFKLSDGIITSTQYLKEKYAELFPDKPCYVVRNSIDFDLWDSVEHKRPMHEQNPDLIRITYSGCGNHSGDLEMIVNPIKVLLEEFPNLEFVSLPYPSTDKIDHPRYKRLDKWVSMSIFPQKYSEWESDIAIAPLRDNEFNRAKSNLRWLESSAFSIPMVASNVYPFKNSIDHKRTGLLVGNSQKEWYESLKQLIVDKGMRTAIGQNAYKTVKKDFNMKEVAKSYLSILKQIKHEFINASDRNRSASL